MKTKLFVLLRYLTGAMLCLQFFIASEQAHAQGYEFMITFEEIAPAADGFSATFVHYWHVVRPGTTINGEPVRFLSGVGDPKPGVLSRFDLRMTDYRSAVRKFTEMLYQSFNRPSTQTAVSTTAGS